MAESKINPTPIARDRCTPGGLAGTDAMDWALRAALALLGVSAIWFVFVAVRPLAAGEAQTPPVIPAIAAIHHTAAPINERQSRLASLNSGGNIFASDRLQWPIHQASATPTPDDPDATAGRGTTRAPENGITSAGDIDRIELTDNASAAVRKRLDQLKLRGVYVIGGKAAAMIGQKTNPGSEVYRVGDTLDDGEWRLVAIDDARDRVILSRSGQSFALNLYETDAATGVATGATSGDTPGPRPAINAAPAIGEVEIGFTSLDKVAAELREAGLPRDQINELLTLALERPGTEASTVVSKPDAEKAKPVAIPPAMPPGMVQLFKAMAEGSREVVPPPATAPDADGGDPPATKDDDKQ
jgi:hypothetical protein